MRNERGQAMVLFALLLIVIALAILGAIFYKKGLGGILDIERERTRQEEEQTAQEQEKTRQIAAEYRGAMLLTAAQTAQTGAFLTMMFPYLIWGTVVIVGVMAGLFIVMRMPLHRIMRVVSHTELPPPSLLNTKPPRTPEYKVGEPGAGHDAH